MTKRFFVTEETRCDDCHGNGVITNPEWERFYKAMLGRGITHYTVKDTDVDTWFQTTDWPPEELYCPVCNGKGRIRRDVDLAVALKELGR